MNEVLSLRVLRCTLAALSILGINDVARSQSRVVAPAMTASLAAAPPQRIDGVAADDATFSTIATPSAALSAALPEDPSALLSGPVPTPGALGDVKSRQQANAEREASVHMKHIPPGWRVAPLTRKDKVLLGVDDLFNPLTVSTIVLSAGYSHLVNGQPNFGTNSAAFAQRFGAAFARDESQGLLTDAVFAPLLHEDPRYYRRGAGHGFWNRTVYAVTRPLVTRDDRGRATANSALLLGYASAAGLTYAYYPQSNRNGHDVASTFGGSIGGAAFGDFVDEFSPEILGALHLHHRE